MITILRLIQNMYRSRWRTLGHSELTAVWLLTGVAFIALGCQLLGAMAAATLARILNKGDNVRAIQDAGRTGSRRRTRPRADARATQPSVT